MAVVTEAVLRHCPRCGGKLITDRDEYGWFQDCLQCGYHGDLSASEPLPRVYALALDRGHHRPSRRKEGEC